MSLLTTYKLLFKLTCMDLKQINATTVTQGDNYVKNRPNPLYILGFMCIIFRQVI